MHINMRPINIYKSQIAFLEKCFIFKENNIRDIIPRTIKITYLITKLLRLTPVFISINRAMRDMGMIKNGAIHLIYLFIIHFMKQMISFLFYSYYHNYMR